jgi:hypothetical protein
MEKKNKKSDKKASELFHNIMAASVKGNPALNKTSATKANQEVIAINDNYRITQFTIIPGQDAVLALKTAIEKYVKVMSGYTVYKEEDNPFAAIVVEILRK